MEGTLELRGNGGGRVYSLIPQGSVPVLPDRLLWPYLVFLALSAGNAVLAVGVIETAVLVGSSECWDWGRSLLSLLDLGLSK